MKAFGFDLNKGSRIKNSAVGIGTTFPTVANPGELFWYTGGATTVSVIAIGQ